MSQLTRLKRALAERVQGPSKYCSETCLVSDELRVVYAYIPKSACTSIKTWLLRYGGFSPQIARQFEEAETRGEKGPDAHRLADEFALRHRSRAEIERVLSDPSYFKFTVVRHPLRRLVSAYLDKVVKVKSTAFEVIQSGQVAAGCLSAKTALNWMRGLPLDRERSLTFREFVTALRGQRPAQLDVHFRAQHRLLRGIEFDTVGKLETLEQDFASVQQHLNVTVPLPVRHAFEYEAVEHGECVADWPAARFRTIKAPQWGRFYDAPLLPACESLYDGDFKRFNYECRLPG
ncbi:Sulfotransferase family protein [Anatilimnocola aggregata]|uniref:Sulfotransferase family protein n=1 Tax=Anatilimnocola aggregata TaxID=2528021 RepID=A0A517YJ38_9BACT|nr:sulfotransferase family protein [Anatilimnocola aggregata]QDU30243.1 Sulfotransferase family protein [Anatilimnocola aggregata]